MKWMKTGLWIVCLAFLLGAPLVSFANDPPAPVSEQQQTVAAPADQGTDQDKLPAVPTPPAEGQNSENK